MQNKWSWSVAVMCYNEAPTLKETVNRLVGFFHSEGIEYDISIINDGSQDESLNIANHLASENPCIQVINFEKNKGVAEVLRCAYSQAANKDFLSIIPADLEFPPEELKKALPVMHPNRVVFFTINKLPPLARRLISLCQKLINFIFFGVRVKRINWVKVIPSKYVRDLDIISTTPLIETEVAYKLKKKKLKFIEVDGENDIRIDRQGGYSKLRLAFLTLKSFLEVFSLRIKLWIQSLRSISILNKTSSPSEFN